MRSWTAFAGPPQPAPEHRDALRKMMDASTRPAARRRSAVIISVPLPSPLRRLRSRHDPMARLGVPPHVTLLYPFVPADGLARDDRANLARIAASHRPFEMVLLSVGAFPETLYLAPRPEDPMRSLIASVGAAFPTYPPYGGAIDADALIPHMTIAAVAGSTAADLRREIAASLPLRVSVSWLTVIAEGDTGRWSVRWRLRLGART